MVTVSVDTDSPVPPYEQLRGHLTAMILSGTLAHDARLPSIRQLAADLGLATGTVARAYRELESDGLIVTRGRNGTVVSRTSPAFSAQEIRQRLADAARAFVQAGQQIGASPEHLRRALDDALDP